MGRARLKDSYDIHGFVLAINKKFQGIACPLSKKFGQGTLIGQTLQIVSNRLFVLLLDHINLGKC